ncbi:regulator [Pseudooceanicola sediminis]|uniref:Regulator n=1 Tax=Pseudooceanicola sediminis TaxID=2211117 RepID=A0A399J1V5_9RHOB|nr:NepR family anti-sigma factor [Pseudooceanicola sediminis]KAA2314732.1 regulator [Puniceibacterium sp. HSS470]RII39315.1 regulator [Pseudooceanicola sediminis]|tara:strand:+ start:160490 stop:160657 length:168 start_codon:yes stop_codon:yes gene_type:complete
MALGQSNTGKKGGIDDNLRKVFQSTLDEDIPDRFKDLLNQLKNQDSTASAEGDRK